MTMFELGRFKTIVIAIAGFLTFIAAVLALNFQLSGRFASDAVSMRLTAQQSMQPQIIFDTTQLIGGRLEARAEIQNQIETLRRAAQSYDNTLTGILSGKLTDPVSGATFSAASLKTADAQSMLSAISDHWA